MTPEKKPPLDEYFENGWLQIDENALKAQVVPNYCTIPHYVMDGNGIRCTTNEKGERVIEEIKIDKFGGYEVVNTTVYPTVDLRLQYPFPDPTDPIITE